MLTSNNLYYLNDNHISSKDFILENDAKTMEWYIIHARLMLEYRYDYWFKNGYAKYKNASTVDLLFNQQISQLYWNQHRMYSESIAQRIAVILFF